MLNAAIVSKLIWWCKIVPTCKWDWIRFVFCSEVFWSSKLFCCSFWASSSLTIEFLILLHISKFLPWSEQSRRKFKNVDVSIRIMWSFHILNSWSSHLRVHFSLFYNWPTKLPLSVESSRFFDNLGVYLEFASSLFSNFSDLFMLIFDLKELLTFNFGIDWWRWSFSSSHLLELSLMLKSEFTIFMNSLFSPISGDILRLEDWLPISEISLLGSLYNCPLLLF